MSGQELHISQGDWLVGQARHGRRAQGVLSLDPLQVDCIAQFRKHVRQRPDAVVVSDGVRQLTFAQVLHAGEALAFKLRDVPRDDYAFALLHSDVYLAVIVVGLHLAGVKAITIDAVGSTERQQALFADVRPTTILVSELHPEVPAHLRDGVRVIVAELDGERDAVVRAMTPDEEVGIAFTSGSTGKPKGLIVTRLSLMRHVFDFIENTDLSPDDKIASLGPPGGLGARAVLAGLFSGASVYLADIKEVGLGGAFAQPSRFRRFNRIKNLA